MMYPLPVLQTARIKLRKLGASDAVHLQKNADDELVWRNLFDGFPSPYTEADALTWCTKGAHDPQMGYVWGIEIDGQIIGCISVMPDTGWLRCNAELGYWIGQGHWGQGITPEALRLVMGWAEEHLKDITRFYAPVFSWNTASQKVLQKNGFLQEAVMQRSAIKAGQIIDRIVWAKYI
jgi:[ribosomal protein S5]-alanine N-acetyltransferase